MNQYMYKEQTLVFVPQYSHSQCLKEKKKSSKNILNIYSTNKVFQLKITLSDDFLVLCSVVNVGDNPDVARYRMSFHITT
jgi:hypothetical protein